MIGKSKRIAVALLVAGLLAQTAEARSSFQNFGRLATGSFFIIGGTVALTTAPWTGGVGVIAGVEGLAGGGYLMADAVEDMLGGNPMYEILKTFAKHAISNTAKSAWNYLKDPFPGRKRNKLQRGFIRDLETDALEPIDGFIARNSYDAIRTRKKDRIKPERSQARQKKREKHKKKPSGTDCGGVASACGGKNETGGDDAECTCENPEPNITLALGGKTGWAACDKCGKTIGVIADRQCIGSGDNKRAEDMVNEMIQKANLSGLGFLAATITAGRNEKGQDGATANAPRENH